MSPSTMLAGVRVLDLSSFFSGPLCGYMLAQMGAEVIKIEEPEAGDPSRRLGLAPELSEQLMGAAFLAANGGKRSVALNLKSPEGIAVFKKMVAGSTVVLENFRPGVMQRLGIDYEVLRQVKPDLIYCAISGFGQSGPLREFPAFDQIIQGMSGLMSITGSDETGALRTGFPVSDSIAGITAATAIAGAICQHTREGKGAMLDVAMLDSLMCAMGWAVSNYLIAGTVPRPMGNDNFTASPSGTFHASDGMLNIAINTETQYRRLLAVLGDPPFAADPRFASRELRKHNRAAINRFIDECLKARTVAEWVEILAREGVPAGPVYSVPEAFDAPQVKDRDLLQRFENVLPGKPDLAVLRPGFKVSGESIGVATPPAHLGADTDEVLAGFGYSEAALTELARAGAIRRA